MARLSRAEIRRALDSLADELEASPDKHLLAIAGGAALVLLYGARDSTKDVDGFSISSTDANAIRHAAARVAKSLGLPEDWLNDGAKGYLHGLALGEKILDRERLEVHALDPRQLLAMKLSAWRDDLDISDARLILSNLTGSREEIWKGTEPYLVPGRELKARYAFDDLWEAEHGS